MTVHTPRPYQANAIHQVYDAWRSVRNVCLVMPTGAGKTYTFARIVSEFAGAVAVIAHRAELVTQMSVALAREGVRHRVIGPDSLRRTCVQLQIDDCGATHMDPNARVAVCSVATLARLSAADSWISSVRLWIQDECHHVLRDNQWGRAVALFPNALGLGVTATPTRLDGRGLGSHADGVFDHMVVGPTMRDLIGLGYLCDYRPICAPSDIDLTKIGVSAGGDYSPVQLASARKRSHITGDVVREYLRHARGKLGLTFDVDIESATETANAYRAAGVPAEVVSSKTPDLLRASIMRSFKARQILQIVNVDLLGEGVDVPAVEVVSMARPTKSYSLFAQQFGRALRPSEGKDRAILLDHVGNIAQHGLPDARSTWSLDARSRRSTGPSDAVPVRTCLNETCMTVYERLLDACPECGLPAPPPAGRTLPVQVDGVLEELTPETLAVLRGEITRVNSAPFYPAGANTIVAKGIDKRFIARQGELAALRDAIARWGGKQGAVRGLNDRQQQKAFYFRFGVDVGTAQTLGAPEAEALRALVEADL